jgi:large subunit ribosomal protein L24
MLTEPTITQYKKSNPLLPDPENFDSLSQEDQQRFRQQQNYLVISRPVHYSNVQLCVEERDPIEGKR